MGQEVSSVRTPEQFGAYLASEEEKSRKLIKDANIAAEEGGS